MKIGGVGHVLHVYIEGEFMTKIIYIALIIFMKTKELHEQ